MSRAKQLADAIDAFVKGTKADGTWDSIKACCILAGWDSLDGCLVPLKGPAPTNNNFTESDLDRATGLVGDGSTTYLDSNRNNNADPQDSQHVSVYVSSVATVSSDMYFATPSANGAGSTSVYRGSVTTNWGSRRPASASVLDVANADMGGFVGVSRFQSSNFEYRANGTTTTSGAFLSGTPENGNVSIFSASNTFHGNCRLALYLIGESLDLAALDARVTALITAIGAAI